MDLLVEFGNTRVKWALAEHERLRSRDAALHRQDPAWPDRLPTGPVDTVWYASVAADEVTQPLYEWCERRRLSAPRRVTATSTAAGVHNAYADAARLGVDRWLACLAARRRASGGVAMVVDAGTALTVDLVAADGTHRGGVISPGVATMRGSIRADTQVRATDIAVADGWLGTDTDTAVALGTLHAAAGLVERLQARLAPDYRVLTGGEADELLPHLPGEWQVVPGLVLEGLAIAAAEAADSR